MKPSIFVIEQYIKHIQKGGKLNEIVLKESDQKDVFADEVGVPNDVLHV